MKDSLSKTVRLCMLVLAIIPVSVIANESSGDTSPDRNEKICVNLIMDASETYQNIVLYRSQIRELSVMAEGVLSGRLPESMKKSISELHALNAASTSSYARLSSISSIYKNLDCPSDLLAEELGKQDFLKFRRTN